jgi:hypothetical protein
MAVAGQLYFFNNDNSNNIQLLRIMPFWLFQFGFNYGSINLLGIS